MAGFAFPTVAPVVSSTVTYSPTLDYAGVLAEDKYAAWVLGEQALPSTLSLGADVLLHHARYAADSDHRPTRRRQQQPDIPWWYCVCAFSLAILPEGTPPPAGRESFPDYRQRFQLCQCCSEHPVQLRQGDES